MDNVGLITKESYITVVNYTDRNIKIQVTETDNGDWETQNRPDVNLNNVDLPRGTEVRRQADVNTFRNTAWFRMTFVDEKGDVGTFRTDQYQVFNGTNIFDVTMDDPTGKNYKLKQIIWNASSYENIFIIARSYGN